MEPARADDYLVRLDVRPRPPAGEAPAPAGERTRRFGGLRPRLLIVALLAVAALANRATVVDWLQDAVSSAKKPVQVLHGGDHLDRAEDVLARQWARDRTFNVSTERLAELDGSVDWAEIVRFRPCLGGTAATLTATTARGTETRLVVAGSEQGSVPGDPGCPVSRTRLAPWTGI